MGSVKPTLQLLLLSFCCSLALLLDEPLSELLPLSLPPALTARVLAHQARKDHLCVTWVCFPTAVWIVQVKLPLSPRLLVLMPEVYNGLFHYTLLLLLSVVEEASYFAVMEHISICMERDTYHNALQYKL